MKSYCCLTVKFACKQYDCNAGIPNGWSEEKQAYCCDKTGTGCTTTNGPVAFDCNAGLANWEAGWNDQKQIFCCSKTGVSCDPYDCNEKSVASWSATKQGWCCDKKKLGCQKTDSQLFDCNAGFANWETGWSTGKKYYCCKKQGRACDQYDCGTAASNALYTPSGLAPPSVSTN